MGASQFDRTVTQLTTVDGLTRVGGPQTFPFPVETVEYRFLLVQGDVVVKGTGTGQGSTWSGTTDPHQELLQEGPVLGVGLAIAVRSGGSPGFETFNWAEQVQLRNG
jgi:hypothetical protein